MNTDPELYTDGNDPQYPDIFPCPYCGSEDNEYIGELYEEDDYIGSDYKCMECGSHWTDSQWNELHS